MYPKIKIGLAPESGQIYYCATWLKHLWPNIHLMNWSICLHSTWKFILFKWLEFHLKLQKTIGHEISKWCHWQSDLVQPNSGTNGRITFRLCSYSKLLSPIMFTFHQNKALKMLWKMLFSSYKLLVWFLQYSTFRR